MKKMTSNCILLQTTLIRRYLLICFAAIAPFYSFATSYTSSASTNWNVATTWTPNGIPGAGDDVTINTNVTITAAASCASLTIIASNTLTLNSSQTLTVSGDLINNGTLGLSGSSTLNVGSGFINNFTNNGTLDYKSASGQVINLNSNWVNNGPTFANNGGTNTVNMIGAGTTIGGTSVTSFYNITINPGGSDMVSLITSNMIIKNGGTLTLQSGFFKVGASNTITELKNVTIAAVNGNFASSIDGKGDTDADGGTILIDPSTSGDALTLTSPSGTILQVNNISTNGNGNWRLKVTNTNSVRINGTLTINSGGSNQWSSTGQAPIWGANSTLYVDHSGQQYTAGTEWNAASGTIGVTPGYPNNVTMTNFGTSAGGFNNNNGWVPGATSLAINGTFTIGAGATNGQVDFSNLTSFTANSVVINSNSRFTAPKATMTLSGNFTDNSGGQVAGSKGFFINTTSTVNFAGGGTSVISTPGKTDAFNNITVTNGTYVQLNSPIQVNSTGVLTLTSGHVGTTSTNSLTVTNTANTAVTGGSPISYVDGPLSWNIPANPAVSYTFPVGDMANNGGAYLPLILTPHTTASTTVTATAFNKNSNGTIDATLTSISTTEYWSVSSTTPFTTGADVDVTRPAPISPFTSLAKSSSAAGTYTSISGTPVSNTEIGSGTMGTTNPEFIVMAAALPIPLSVKRVGGSVNLDANCNPTTGTLIVAGVGGTGPYQYSMTASSGPWQSSTTFSGLAVGSYSVWVKDNTAAVAMATLKVLGPLQINNNNQGITICTPQPITLTATNDQNSNATYSWSPGGATTASITVSPGSTTTYTVTSTVPFTGSNMLAGSSFESGLPTGFSTTYQSGFGPYPTTPNNNGFYKIGPDGRQLCNFFSALGAEDGSNFFIVDGTANCGTSVVFTQSLTGLTVGKDYSFSYWYAAGSSGGNYATLQTTIAGGTITSGGNVVANNSVWAQATYSFTATATTATATLTNLNTTCTTNGDDFYFDNLQLQSLTTCTVTASMTITIDCSPQPVELTYFNATKQGAGALLTWATATEENSSYFIVEKSSDGISFTPIGKINAAGNSSELRSYSFIDPSINAGVTYYRLAQYDIDGTVQHSEIKAVSKEGIIGVQVIPNPNNGVFVIMHDNKGEVKPYSVSILNSLGQVVYEKTELTDNLKSVDISHLASGVYYLQVNTEEDHIVKKIVKE